MGCSGSSLLIHVLDGLAYEAPLAGLEAAFMDTNTSVIKSPGKSSPMGGGMAAGRTMKEYEDQLNDLAKKNFNLKLHIYMLEERMGITSADKDEIKKYIELKVKNENLKEELEKKHSLICQAKSAMEAIVEEKNAFQRNCEQYQREAELERERVAQLESELEECRRKQTDATYYEETFGITPEKALEFKEKLHQVEEIKSSLESELKQLSASLNDERNWAQELENERDELRSRLESEIASKEKLTLKRDRETETLNERIKELEEQVFARDNALQQLKKEVVEKDKVIEEKNSLLEEKNRAYEEVSGIAEKRKKQIDQLRVSIKTRDEALTELNNKNRSLLAQFDNSYTKISSSPASPSMSIEEQQPFGKTYGLCSPNRSFGFLDFEPNSDRAKIRELYSNLERRDSQEMKKELEEREREIKKQEEQKKQLTLKLHSAQQTAEASGQKLKKLEIEYRKAISMIQGFMKRHEQLEDKQAKKDQRIIELETELSKLRNEFSRTSRTSINSSVRKNLSSELLEGPERDVNGKQRFEEMESKINDLRDQIETIKAEKCLLEKKTEIESEELRDRLQDKDLKIECLRCEKSSIQNELRDKSDEYNKLKEKYDKVSSSDSQQQQNDTEKLRQELAVKAVEIEEKNRLIDVLAKELQIKTQNLQQLVNTELWSKNREIAKLQNYVTSSKSHRQTATTTTSDSGVEANFEEASGSCSQLRTLIKELEDLGIQVSFTDDVVQLNYLDGSNNLDLSSIADYIRKLMAQKAELEKEVDYLKWLKVVSKPSHVASTVNEVAACDSTTMTTTATERDKEYCEILRTHLKELIKFMNEMLREQAAEVSGKHKKMVYDALMKSKILSDDFINSLDCIKPTAEGRDGDEDEERSLVRKSKSDNFIDSRANDRHHHHHHHQFSTASESEAFSEPDRVVSLARMGLPEIRRQRSPQSAGARRPSKFAAAAKSPRSDSEDSLPPASTCLSAYQSDAGDFDVNRQILELKEINGFLQAELMALRKELSRSLGDDLVDNKLALLLTKLEKSSLYCEKLRSTLERKIHECHALKRESKQNGVRKLQMEKKMLDVENMALELAKQKAELIQCKETTDRKTAEMLFALNKDNEVMRSKIKKLEDENEESKSMILRLTRELDHLTLTHSQILVDNTKLTNDKLRLEQDLRKSENRYEVAVRNLQDKFHKEVTDLNQINESHRSRVQELEATNKELRRHVVICEASDSAPSSSGISSIPTDVVAKSNCDDIVNDYHAYNGFQYWLPLAYPTSSGRSKSSCSPDLGIESDAALTNTRPLKDTLKITESMTNLLSDEDNGNGNNPGLRDVDDDSPLPLEGLDEVQALKQENVALKRRLMKTRRALEDTFQHLSASNKNKKSVEKAITKQLMITKSILKKTRNYEEAQPYEN